MKKILAILLILAMLAISFAACDNYNSAKDDDDDDGTKKATDTTSSSTETSGSGSLGDLLDGIFGNKDPVTTGALDTPEVGSNEIIDTPENTPPDINYDGYIFRYLDDAQSSGIVVDAGEVIDETSIVFQAQLERDAEIIDRFNISLQDIKTDTTGILSYVLKDSLNAESSFDVGNISINENASELIINDVLMNVRDILRRKLDKPWYQQQANDEYYFLDKQYFVSGAFPSFPTTNNLYFNKDMMNALNLKYPYETILEENWTLEEMEKYTSVSYKDTNGSSSVDSSDDFGLASHPNSFACFYQGMGGVSAGRNEKNEIVPIFSNDQADQIFESLNSFFRSPTNYTKDSDPKNSHMSFFRGNALFCYWMTETLSPRDIESFERGLAILPKYDAEQENYYCPANGDIKLFPANLADSYITGRIYNDLCESTLRIVYPATLQEAVDFEDLTDEGSIEVKRLIIDKSFKFDILKSCDLSGGVLASFGFVQNCYNQNTTPASLALSVQPAYEQIFEKFFEKAEANN